MTGLWQKAAPPEDGGVAPRHRSRPPKRPSRRSEPYRDQAFPGLGDAQRPAPTFSLTTRDEPPGCMVTP
jgi:hypothetical protein